MSATVNNNAGSEANDGQRDKGKSKMSAEDVAHEEARRETQHALAEGEANEAEKRLQDEEMAKLLRRRFQETKEEEERLKRMIDLLEHTSAGDSTLEKTPAEKKKRASTKKVKKSLPVIDDEDFVPRDLGEGEGKERAKKSK